MVGGPRSVRCCRGGMHTAVAWSDGQWRWRAYCPWLKLGRGSVVLVLYALGFLEKEDGEMGEATLVLLNN
jgi:hypothetical protein